MLPAVAMLPALGGTSFLEGTADGLALLAESGMDQMTLFHVIFTRCVQGKIGEFQ